MTMRDKMWNIFKASGNIYAYFYYKESFNYKSVGRENSDKKERVLQGLQA